MSLIDILNTYGTMPYLDTDADWRQFVLDHKLYLRNNAVVQEITPSYLDRYEYNLTLFLTTGLTMGLTPDIVWIVLLINDLKSNIDFRQVRALYVPTMDQVQQLYLSYQTSSRVTVVSPDASR